MSECWMKTGFVTAEQYCGLHGREAGWPCRYNYQGEIDMARVWLHQDIACPTCDGARTCQAGCSSGKVDSGAVDIKNKAIMINCTTCGGRNVCTTCGGKGTVSGRVQVDE